jgi:hypothetical protein
MKFNNGKFEQVRRPSSSLFEADVFPVIDGDLGAARARPQELNDAEKGFVALLPRPV